MPGTSTTTPELFEHQPRERGLACQRGCGRKETWNDHGVCDTCLDAGADVTCFALCRDVARAQAARAAGTVRSRQLVTA